MPIEPLEELNGRLLHLRVMGKLTPADYPPLVERFGALTKQHGKIRVLCELLDFHGWEVGALWDELKFDLQHFAEIERLAVVGDKTWEKGLTQFSRPFTRAEVRYFDVARARDAREWIEGGLIPPPVSEPG